MGGEVGEGEGGEVGREEDGRGGGRGIRGRGAVG